MGNAPSKTSTKRINTSPVSGEKNSLHAGVAKRDITTENPGVNIHDRLYAKAFVISDGTTTMAIIAMDAVAIGGICDVRDDFLVRLRMRIENELHIPGSHVLVHATHTHPPGRLLCDDDQQIERAFDAVRQAHAALVPVKVGTGCGQEDRIIINRTLRLKNGQHWTIRQTNPCPPDDEVESLGPIDPSIGVLRVDRLDGTPLAVVYNYACHPLIGVARGQVTANYPGFASQVIEENLGHDVMAIFLQGAAGDVTEVAYKDVHEPSDSEPVGRILGLSTLKTWQTIQTNDAPIKMVFETVMLPRKNDFSQCIDALVVEQKDLLASLRFTSLNIKTFIPLYVQYMLSPEHPSNYSYRYLHAQAVGSEDLSATDERNRQNLDKYLGNIRAMEKLARIEDKIATLKRHETINDLANYAPIEAEIQGIRIGEFVLVSSPIEVLTQVSLNIKKMSPHKHTYLAAFSNGYMHYGPPASDYGKGGYEVTECFLAPQWQSLYEAKTQKVLNRL